MSKEGLSSGFPDQHFEINSSILLVVLLFEKVGLYPMKILFARPNGVILLPSS